MTQKTTPTAIDLAKTIHNAHQKATKAMKEHDLPAFALAVSEATEATEYFADGKDTPLRDDVVRELRNLGDAEDADFVKETF